MIFFLQDGTDYLVKVVCPGDSIHSLLSVLDVLTVSLLKYYKVVLCLKCGYDNLRD